MALLEAGPPDNNSPFSVEYIPLTGMLLQKTEIDWAYMTVPQKHACYALNDQVPLSVDLVLIIKRIKYSFLIITRCMDYTRDHINCMDLSFHLITSLTSFINQMKIIMSHMPNSLALAVNCQLYITVICRHPAQCVATWSVAGRDKHVKWHDGDSW